MPYVSPIVESDYKDRLTKCTMEFYILIAILRDMS